MQFAAEKFKADREIVLAAVGRSGWGALGLADRRQQRARSRARVREDFDVLVAAVLQHGAALAYAPVHRRSAVVEAVAAARSR